MTLGSAAWQRPAAGASLNRFSVFVCLFTVLSAAMCTMCCDRRAREEDRTQALMFPSLQNNSLVGWLFWVLSTVAFVHEEYICSCFFLLLAVKLVKHGPLNLILHFTSVYSFDFYSLGLQAY